MSGLGAGWIFGTARLAISRKTSLLAFAMKTTIDLPDPLVRRSKIAAIEQGMSFRQYVAESLEHRLDGGAEGKGCKPWLSAFGKLSHRREENRRIDRLIADEFGSVDPDGWK